MRTIFPYNAVFINIEPLLRDLLVSDNFENIVTGIEIEKHHRNLDTYTIEVLNNALNTVYAKMFSIPRYYASYDLIQDLEDQILNEDGLFFRIYSEKYLFHASALAVLTGFFAKWDGTVCRQGGDLNLETGYEITTPPRVLSLILEEDKDKSIYFDLIKKFSSESLARKTISVESGGHIHLSIVNTLNFIKEFDTICKAVNILYLCSSGYTGSGQPSMVKILSTWLKQIPGKKLFLFDYEEGESNEALLERIRSDISSKMDELDAWLAYFRGKGDVKSFMKRTKANMEIAKTIIKIILDLVSTTNKLAFNVFDIGWNYPKVPLCDQNGTKLTSSRILSILDNYMSDLNNAHSNILRLITSPSSVKRIHNCFVPYLPLLYALYPERTENNYCRKINYYTACNTLGLRSNKYNAIRIKGASNSFELRIPRDFVELKTLMFRLNLVDHIIKSRSNVKKVMYDVLYNENSEIRKLLKKYIYGENKERFEKFIKRFIYHLNTFCYLQDLGIKAEEVGFLNDEEVKGINDEVWKIYVEEMSGRSLSNFEMNIGESIS